MTPDERVLIYAADMVKDKDNVEKDLRDGKIVIMDRYFLSTVAYGAAGGSDYEQVKRIETAIKLPVPDLVLLFDLPPLITMLRKEGQRKEEGGKMDRFESANNIQERAMMFYNKMYVDGFGAKEWAVIKAEQNAESVHKAVREAVSRVLETGAERVKA